MVIAGGIWVGIVIFDTKPKNSQFWGLEKWLGGGGRRAFQNDATTNSQW